MELNFRWKRNEPLEGANPFQSSKLSSTSMTLDFSEKGKSGSEMAPQRVGAWRSKTCGRLRLTKIAKGREGKEGKRREGKGRENDPKGGLGTIWRRGEGGLPDRKGRDPPEHQLEELHGPRTSSEPVFSNAISVSMLIFWTLFYHPKLQADPKTSQKAKTNMWNH